MSAAEAVAHVGPATSRGRVAEVVGRGIYGDYVLVIPPGEFRMTKDGEGLDLAAIDDILLRFDYVSVAQ